MYVFIKGQDTQDSRFAPTYTTEGSLTVADIHNKLNLDSWQAVKVPNYKPESWGNVPVKNSFYLAKNYINGYTGLDNGKVLNPYVSERYGVIQYSQGLKWLQYYVDEQLVTLDSALYIDDTTMAVTCSSNIRENIIADDPIETYLVLSLGHGKSSRRMLGFTTIRPVCRNTLHAGQVASLHEVGKSFTLSSSACLQQAKEVMDLTQEKFGTLTNTYKTWANTTIGAFDKETVYRQAAGIRPNEDSPTSIQLRTLDQLENAYRNSPGMELFDNDCTGWRLYNAVTYVADRIGGNDVTRYQSSVSGYGSAMRARAAAVIKELCT